MTRISPARNVPPPVDDEEAAIARANTPRFQWKTILLWLLRLSAIACMARGISYWMELLGLFTIDFRDRATLHQFAIVFSASIYCFTSVGLWMAAAWGVVLWVIALTGEAALLIFEPSLAQNTDILTDTIPKLGSYSYLVIGVTSIVAYIWLYWLVERENK
jgi:Family of unknown function (DUF6163)